MIPFLDVQQNSLLVRSLKNGNFVMPSNFQALQNQILTFDCLICLSESQNLNIYELYCPNLKVQNIVKISISQLNFSNISLFLLNSTICHSYWSSFQWMHYWKEEVSSLFHSWITWLLRISVLFWKLNNLIVKKINWKDTSNVSCSLCSMYALFSFNPFDQ